MSELVGRAECVGMGSEEKVAAGRLPIFTLPTTASLGLKPLLQWQARNQCHCHCSKASTVAASAVALSGRSQSNVAAAGNRKMGRYSCCHLLATCLNCHCYPQHLPLRAYRSGTGSKGFENAKPPALCYVLCPPACPSTCPALPPATCGELSLWRCIVATWWE